MKTLTFESQHSYLLKSHSSKKIFECKALQVSKTSVKVYWKDTKETQWITKKDLNDDYELIEDIGL